MNVYQLCIPVIGLYLPGKMIMYTRVKSRWSLSTSHSRTRSSVAPLKKSLSCLLSYQDQVTRCSITHHTRRSIPSSSIPLTAPQCYIHPKTVHLKFVSRQMKTRSSVAPADDNFLLCLIPPDTTWWNKDT